MRFASSESMTVCIGGSRRPTASVMTSTFRAPISARSIPTSRVTPAPKRIDDTAISNALSKVMQAGLPTESKVGFREDAMEVTIVEQPELRIAGIRHIGPYQEIGREFGRLGHILKGPPPPGSQMIALYHDDPEVTPV